MNQFSSIFAYKILQLESSTIRSDESLCYICKYASVEIKPELKKHISNFGYGINYTYKGMLAHSLDRFYVVTKFILPNINDLKFSTINFDDTCK